MSVDGGDPDGGGGSVLLGNLSLPGVLALTSRSL